MEFLKKLDNKGQIAGVGAALIGIVMTIVIVTLLITVGTSVNVQLYDNVDDDIAALPAAAVGIEQDANTAIESGFEAIAETGDNLNIVVVGVMAAIVISVVMGALAGAAYSGRRGGAL